MSCKVVINFFSFFSWHRSLCFCLRSSLVSSIDSSITATWSDILAGSDLAWGLKTHIRLISAPILLRMRPEVILTYLVWFFAFLIWFRKMLHWASKSSFSAWAWLISNLYSPIYCVSLSKLVTLRSECEDLGLLCFYFISYPAYAGAYCPFGLPLGADLHLFFFFFLPLGFTGVVYSYCSWPAPKFNIYHGFCCGSESPWGENIFLSWTWLGETKSDCFCCCNNLSMLLTSTSYLFCACPSVTIGDWKFTFRPCLWSFFSEDLE